MAFGTWFKNLITKGKALIKKAAPVIRKGVEIAKKVAPVIGGTIGNIINGVANAVDKGVNYIAPLQTSNNVKLKQIQESPPNNIINNNTDSDSDPPQRTRRIIGGKNGVMKNMTKPLYTGDTLIPILK